MGLDISIDWGTVVISASAMLFSIIKGAQYFSRKYVDQRFLEKLEHHKHELQGIMEFNKFDLQRKMQDFNLFTTKKHEAYTTLYKLFLEADGYAGSIMGYRQVTDYKKYSYDEVSRLFDEYNIGDIDKSPILDNWDNRHSDDSVIGNLRYVMNRTLVNVAKDYQRKAQNEFYYSKLYLSEKVDEIYYELSNCLKFNITDIEVYHCGTNDQHVLSEALKNINSNNQKISALFKTLKLTMQEELSIGYYKNQT
ncbi:hypothetical protein [Paenibacillus amylolyticus]|uniref:hypothetical protein n=1 Tax=Paenibacillus amylolyticus TaxID=1451 RepID=UPI000B894E93|nr:hypothetical protein [Paenibacillus amylolyticus]